MKSSCLLFLVCLLFCSSKLCAQKEITLINGVIYEYKELKVDSNWISFSFLTKENKLKKRILAYEDVFIIRDGAKETVIYGMGLDTSLMPTLDEVRLFVAGQQSGRLAFKPTKHFIIGAAVGLASGIALNSFLVGSAVPPIYTVITTIFPVSNSHFGKDVYASDDAFRFGQRKQYKKMRTGAAIKSSIVGMVAGLLIGSIVANQ